MNIKTITNFDTNHSDAIKRIIDGAMDISIVVAFLKMSGLKLLLISIMKALESGATIKFYVGLDFYQTEPEALKALSRLSKQHNKLQLFTCEKKNTTFHPKIYFAKRSEGFAAIIGSANLTSGGLNDNIELSTLIEGPVNSSACNEIDAYLSRINDIGTNASSLSISQYKKKYDINNKNIKKASKESEKEFRKNYVIDTSKMAIYIKEYLNDDESASDLAKKKENYKKAKMILDKLIDNGVSSKEEFMEYYDPLVGGKGTDKLWHSGNIHRSKNRVVRKYKEVISVISNIRKNISENKSPAEVFKNATESSKKINGLGINILTEVMNTFNPKKYAVLNKNPLGALSKLGFENFKQAQTFNAKDYQEFNDLIKDISMACNFEDLSQVDHFCNFIYQKYVKERS